MTKRANLKSCRKQGRPYKAMQWSFDDTADKTFTIAGQILKDADNLPLSDKLKVLSICLPLALKRIPDKLESISVNLSIDDATAHAMLDEARRNLLIYQEIDKVKSVQVNPAQLQINPGRFNEINPV